MKQSERAAAITTSIERWFTAPGVARPFPWRTPSRDPYTSLVAEVMLQQTQAARVAERLPQFLSRFPTIAALARADEDAVLAQWSGLGYYRRAKNLHAAARAVAADFAGAVPHDVDSLLTLPGVGRYTAGAIASIACGAHAPIADGNVARVLLRIEGKPMEHGAPDTMQWVWKESARLVQHAANPAAFNEGLMELGATICTPKSPRCPDCPAAALCRARKRGQQEQIPTPKRRAERTTLHHAAVIVRDDRGRILVEQRPPRGLWAGLWQAPTLETTTHPAKPAALTATLGLTKVRKRTTFEFLTTHRVVRFAVWEGEVADGRAVTRGTFKTSGQIGKLALGAPQRRILESERT